MGKHGSRTSQEVEETMHEYKYQGKFKNRAQAIAVGLSKARRTGDKVPKER